jgi:hypothetical protein
MKNKTAFVLAALVYGLSITACPTEAEDDPPQPLPGPFPNGAYTIMLYGAGGGDLDKFLKEDLDEAKRGAPYMGDKVRLTAHYNWSKAAANQPYYEPYTQRKFLNADGNFENAPGYPNGVTERLDESVQLSGFIKWSAEKCPSDRYILVLWNHGDGWTPETDPAAARGIIFDDNHAESPNLSLNSLVKGINDSKIPITVVYYDACLMNMLENITELGKKAGAGYSLAAGHTTPGVGGQYEVLIKTLAEGVQAGKSIEEIFQTYCDELVKTWPSNHSGDIAFTDLGKLDPLLNALKDIAGRLKELYAAADAAGKEIYDSPQKLTLANHGSGDGVYFYDYKVLYDPDTKQNLWPYGDIYSYMKYLTGKTGDETLEAKTNNLVDAMNAAIYGADTPDFAAAGGVNSYSITLAGGALWEAGRYYGNSAYAALEFAKATGWDSWLQTCNILVLE